MSDVLRELLASFVVEVDKAGELAKGNAAVDALKERLTELQDAFKKVKAPAEQTGKAIEDVFARAAQTAKKNIDAIAALSAFGGGRANATGFGDAFGAAADRAAGALPQYGPTRETLYDHQRAEFVADANAHKLPQFGPTRETFEQGRAAAEAYAKTLRGKLAAAVAAVREGFNGAGGGGKGPGLIASLATVRNGFLALGAGVAVHAVKGLVDGIGDISEGSARLGVTTDEFQRMSAYARQNATDVDTLGTAFRTLATSAVDPTKETTAAFAKLGVSTKDSNGEFKSSQELFFDVGESLAGVTNETVRTQLAQKLLGRSAIALKPMFAQGTEAFRRQREEMLKLKVLSPEVIDAADSLSDSWVVLGAQLLATAGPVLQDTLFPALKALTGFLVKGVEGLGKLLKTTDFVAAGITALAYVLQAKLIPGLVSVVAKGVAASGSMLKFAASGAKAAISFARLALGLLVLDDFITFLRGGDSETGRLIEAIFGKDGVEVTLKAINDLKAGLVDLWNWVTGKGNGEGIKRLWQEFGNGITVMINDLLHSVGIGKGGTDGPFKLMEEISRSSGTGQSYINTPGAYGPPTADGSTRGNAGTAVTIGDTNVTITGYSASDSKRIADDLDTTLERNRDGLAAQWP